MSRVTISGDDLVEQLITTNTINMRDGHGQTALLRAPREGNYISPNIARQRPDRLKYYEYL